MHARYAVYYAPDSQSEVWPLASRWLGRDAANGENVLQAVPKDIGADRFAELTTSARRYGFHATLKAPMHLANGADVERLLEMAEAFANAHAPVEIGGMCVQSLGGFLAIVPVRQPGAVTQLAANCVAHFEPLRAPMSAESRQKRLANGLTARQAELLDQYGYPYVMEEFRMHLTLTDRLSATEHALLEPAAREWFAAAIVKPWNLDRISIYREEAQDGPFRRLADFPLVGAKQGVH